MARGEGPSGVMAQDMGCGPCRKRPQNGEGPARHPHKRGMPGPGPASLRPRRAGPVDQAAIGFDIVSTASVMRAESGAKVASASFSEASCSFVLSARAFSIAVRA